MIQQNLPIKIWAEEDRPREKLISKGRKALSDAELLAIIIGSGTPNKTAVELSRDILNAAENNLNLFSKFSLSDLIKHKGIGHAKALSILACMELGCRRKEYDLPKKIRVTTSQTAYNYLKSTYQDLEVEEFHIILLNRANEIIKKVQISQGGVSGTVADGKIVFKAALEVMASGIILSHNHPSGRAIPSDCDISLTKKMRNFGAMIQISVVDHLIITDNNYFSFADNQML